MEKRFIDSFENRFSLKTVSHLNNDTYLKINNYPTFIRLTKKIKLGMIWFLIKSFFI